MSFILHFQCTREAQGREAVLGNRIETFSDVTNPPVLGVGEALSSYHISEHTPRIFILQCRLFMHTYLRSTGP